MLLSLTHRPKTHDAEADRGNTGGPARRRHGQAGPHVSAGPGCTPVWLRWSLSIRHVPAGLDLTSHPWRSLGDEGCPLQMRRPWARVAKGLAVGRRGEELGSGLCLPQVPAGYQSSWLK